MANDLDSLMRNLGPGVGAQWAGQREGLEQNHMDLGNQELSQRIAEMTQANNFNTQMNPLKLQQAGLQNQGLQAGLGGIQASSDLAQTNAQKAQGTLQTDIQEKNSTNLERVDEDKAKKMQRAANTFNTAGPWLANQPPPMRLGMLKNILQQNNVDLESDQGKMFTQMAEQVDSDHLPQFVSELGNKLAEQSTNFDPKYRNAMSIAKVTADRNVDVAKIHASATLGAAQIAADSRQAVAASKAKATDILTQVQSGKLSMEKAAVAFDVMAHMESDPEQRQQYAQMAQKFEQANLVAKQAQSQGKPDIGAIAGLPTQQVNPVLGGGAQPAPIAPNTPSPAAAQGGRVSVIGPNGKRGTIPAAQLQQALQQGYKQGQ